jgi:hypothetical protein
MQERHNFLDPKKNVTKTDKEMLKMFEDMCARFSKTYNPSKVHRKSFFDFPRKYKLTQQDKEFLPKNMIEFLQIQQTAIDVVNKHIENIEKSKDKNLQAVLLDLRNGVKILEKIKSRFVGAGISGMEGELERSKKGDRPGFGLSRGFGEFLHCYQKDGKLDPWAEEIDNAVDKIEHYYNNM